MTAEEIKKEQSRIVSKAKAAADPNIGQGVPLEEKAMLAKLSIGVWEGKKKDKQVELKVDDVFGSKKAGSFRKTLMDCPELKAIESDANRARNVIHKTMTMKWNGDGTGILPLELRQEYIRLMRECKDSFEQHKIEFGNVFHGQIKKEEQRLGPRLFKRDDYPTWKQLERKIYFEVEFLPIPTEGDWRVRVQKEELEQIKSDFAKYYEDRISEAMRDPYQRLYDVIKTMADKLSEKDPIFHDTLVGNIAKLVAILPKFNITGDEKLTELTRLAEEELANIDPQDLRDFEDFRKATADLTKAMLDEITEML